MVTIPPFPVASEPLSHQQTLDMLTQQLADNAYITDNARWFIKQPDEMQDLFDLADEANDGH